MAEASTLMRNMLRTLDTKDLTEAGSRAFTRTIIGHIEAVSGVNGDHVPDGLGGFRFKAKFEDAADQGKVNVAGTAMNEIYAEAIRRGIPSATAMRVIYESANKNLLPQIVDDGQGGVFYCNRNKCSCRKWFLRRYWRICPPPPPPPQGQPK